MSEKTEERKCYQWKKGDSYGEVDKAQSEKTIGDQDYIVFESGRLIAKNIIDEFLVEIPSMNEPFFEKEQQQQPQPQQPMNQPVQPAPSGNASMQLDYPSEDELQNVKNGDKYSMGNAAAIPHPDDMPPPVIKQSPANDITAGLVEEGKEHLLQSAHDMTKGLAVESAPPVAPVAPKKSQFDDIIDKTKKVEYNLDLNITVKLPSAAFFEILDEEFLEAHKDDILNALINKIKQTNLDDQIKENLINLYNLK